MVFDISIKLFGNFPVVVQNFASVLVESTCLPICGKCGFLRLLCGCILQFSQRTRTAGLFTLRCAIFPWNTSVFLRKMSCSTQKFLAAGHIGSSQIHLGKILPSGRAVPEILRSRCSMKLPKPIKRIISEVPGLDIPACAGNASYFLLLSLFPRSCCCPCCNTSRVTGSGGG